MAFPHAKKGEDEVKVKFVEERIRAPSSLAYSCKDCWWPSSLLWPSACTSSGVPCDAAGVDEALLRAGGTPGHRPVRGRHL